MADKTRLLAPTTQRRTTGIKPVTQQEFYGQDSDSPATEVNPAQLYRQVNLISRGRYCEVRPGSVAVLGQLTYLPGGPNGVVRAQGYSDKYKVIIRMYVSGTSNGTVWIFDTCLNNVQQAINITPNDYPGNRGAIVEHDGDMYLIAGKVFRIVLSESYYYMYRINCDRPACLTGIDETGDLIYGYRQVYSLARIEGAAGNRLADGARLVWESGTCAEDGVEQDYADAFYATAIGDDIDESHLVSTFAVPTGHCEHATHYAYYRSKNIGYSSGGRTLVNGEALGNNPNQLTWVEDIPICKAIRFNVDAGGAAVATLGTIVRGDVGNTLVDSLGQSFLITACSDVGFTVTSGSPITPGIHYAVLGASDILEDAQQIGKVVTSSHAFDIGDEGKQIYWADGSVSILETLVVVPPGDTYMIAANSAMHNMPAAMNPTSRVWNDTMIDDGSATGEIGLNQRIETGQVLFQPKRFHAPIPYVNCGIISSGYMVVAKRTEPEIYYSAFADRPACMGYYRPVDQEKTIRSPVVDIRILDGVAVIACANAMFILPLNVADNVGLAIIGEFVARLPEPIEKDPSVGIVAYGSIAYRGAGQFIALTNEPDVRIFTVDGWGPSLTIDANTGAGSVRKILSRIDHHDEVIGSYSTLGGYKLRAHRWV